MKTLSDWAEKEPFTKDLLGDVSLIYLFPRPDQEHARLTGDHDAWRDLVY